MIVEVAMVTFIRMFLPLILLVMTAGVDVQQNWGVNYSPSYVCVLRGASVKMSCTIKHPSDHEVKTVFWTKTAFASVGEPPDLCSDPEYRGRVQCLSENKDTYSITLSNVAQADKHIYYCRFTSNRGDGKWTGIPGVQLDVTDLQVETQQRVNEGDSVTLTCKSTCSLTEETTFIWSRNTQTVTKGRVTVNQLQLQSVRRDDTGDYRCAVRGKEHLSSPEVYLDVTCENTLIHIDECIKNLNLETLLFILSLQSYSISNFNSSHSGRFYCEAQNEHGSQRSAALSVSVAGV
ncbi:neurotrimin-like [Xyrauchen texanus]|uniref:neurotrimin-like n=1 Tax=Xyrauchen texanus TaxID=154827 RepID=UPI0022418745|nr:neurotrimin-like [Xyrauchen texanus]